MRIRRVGELLQIDGHSRLGEGRPIRPIHLPQPHHALPRNRNKAAPKYTQRMPQQRRDGALLAHMCRRPDLERPQLNHILRFLVQELRIREHDNVHGMRRRNSHVVFIGGDDQLRDGQRDGGLECAVTALSFLEHGQVAPADLGADGHEGLRVSRRNGTAASGVPVVNGCCLDMGPRRKHVPARTRAREPWRRVADDARHAAAFSCI